MNNRAHDKRRTSRSNDKEDHSKQSSEEDEEDDDDDEMRLNSMKHVEMMNGPLQAPYYHTDSKKPKVKKQTEQKRVITNFVKAITKPTMEARANLHHSKQCSQPLDKSKLLELFFTFLRFDPPVSASVFWKYVKREVYPDRNVFRNRKTGGYKGFSGVQFRHPEIQSDLSQLLHRLSKTEPHLAQPKEALISTLRNVVQSTEIKKDHGNRKKKRSAMEADLDMDVVNNMYMDNSKLDMNQAPMMPTMQHHTMHMEEMESQPANLMDVQQNMLNNQLMTIVQYLTSPTALEVIKLLNDPNVLSALQMLRRMETDPSNDNLNSDRLK